MLAIASNILSFLWGNFGENMQIKNSLIRIEKALNLRFEKDSSLYISKEDTEKLKEYLYKKQNQNIDALVLKLGNKVVSNIVLKNNYLIDINDRNLRSSLEKLFKSLDKSFFVSISRDVVEDKIFSTIEFKEFVEKFFFKEVSLDECAKKYQDIYEKIDNRGVCFARYLAEDYALKNSSANLVRFIAAELKKHPDISNYFSNKNQNFLAKIFSVSPNKADIAKWIIDNNTNATEIYWINGLASLDEDGFNQMVAYVEANPQYNNEITKRICSKYFQQFYMLDIFIQSISNLFLAYRDVRFFLVNMLESDKIKDNNVVLALIRNFKINAGSNEKLLEKISKIESGELKSKLSFTDLMLLDEINNIRNDLSKIPTLLYFNKICYDNHEHAMYLYFNYKDNARVVDVLSFYFAHSLKKYSFDKLSPLNLDQGYVKKIGDWIEKSAIKSNSAKVFLEEYKRDDVLESLFHKR